MKPRLMPSMCGTLRRTPKFTPEASSIMLLGPGVTEVTKAKRTKAKISSRLMVVTLLLYRQTRVCTKTAERRSGEAKIGEEAELTEVNEHSESIFNEASPMRRRFSCRA